MGIRPTGGTPINIPADNVQSRWGAWEAELSGKGDVAGEVLLDTWSLADSANKVSEQNVKDVNLLSPLLDYRSVSTTPTDADAMKGTGQMPFNFQIGPFKGVSKKSNVLVLDGPGLWDLRAQVTASWTANPFGKKLQVYLRVLRPDGSTFSEQAHYAETQNSITIPVVSSVCVPAAGYQVDVWVYAEDGNRGWWSGPKWTRLTAQHISRDVENGAGGETSTPPTEQPEEPEEV